MEVFGEAANTPSQASPFLQWVGGKRRLIPDINKFLSTRIERYYEPFLGGGAVFFTMAHRINEAFLSDLNQELVTTYNVVTHKVEELIEALSEHKQNNRDDNYFYHVRAQEPKDDIAIACLLYTSPSPRDRQKPRMPSSA